ncbi:MAG TPA: ParA family protein [Gelria sp.]|jgi:chromosome partitioning protein|nr:ParA family protein [Gelria sp.]
MATTIVLANRKGGSGKTTSTINIADGLARAGKRVLVVDADSQAHATISCGVLPYNLSSSLYELLLMLADGQQPGDKLLSTIIKDKKLFHLLPAKPDLAALEVEVAHKENSQTLLKDLLLEVENNYDYILIDVPPALGLLSVNGLVAARWLIIPIELTFLSMDGLAQMTGILYKINAGLNPELRLLGILPVKCDLRTNLARSVIAEIRQNFGDNNILSAVRSDIKLAEAPSFGKTIFEYASSCRGAQDYKHIIDIILTRSGGE